MTSPLRDIDLVALAREYAARVHAKQFRRDGVTPYITHTQKVAAMLAAQGYSDIVVAAAHLHDAIEDAGETEETLSSAGFPDRVIQIVSLLTRHPSIDYDKYIRAIADDPEARMVKIADMLANLTDDPTPAQVKRYAKSLLFLANRD